MKMRQNRHLPCFLLLLFLLPVGAAYAAGNLLRNAGMETGAGEVLPDWRFESYTGSQATFLRTKEAAFEGEWSVYIENKEADHSRLVQEFKVTPDSFYKLSARVKPENISPEGKGAYLGLPDQTRTSPELKGTRTDWTELTFYVRTAGDTAKMEICLALGGFGSLSKGKVFFDAVHAEKINRLPPGATFIQLQLKPENLPRELFRQDEKQQKVPLLDKLRPPSPALAALGAILPLLLLLLLIIFLPRSTTILSGDNLTKIMQGLRGDLPSPQTETRIHRIYRKHIKPVCLVFLLFVFIWFLAYFSHQDSGKEQESSILRQASLLLEGKITLQNQTENTVRYEENNYIVAPLLPSLLLTPFVYFFGMNTNLILLALAMALGSLLVLWKLLRKLGLPFDSLPWLCAAFFAGTGFLFTVTASRQGIIFSHPCAILFCLLAIYEALINGRGLAAGLFMSLALLCREATFPLALFCFFALLESNKESSPRLRRQQCLFFSLTICGGLLIFCAYNWLRFGNPLATGMAQLLLRTQPGGAGGKGLFHPSYLALNFHALFLQGMTWQFKGLRISGLSPSGTAFLFASPFLIFALTGKWKTRLKISAWASIGIILVGQLFFASTGAPQWNTMRYTLDFMPLLFLLTAIGIRKVKPLYWRGAVVYALVLNILAFWAVLPAGVRYIF